MQNQQSKPKGSGRWKVIALAVFAGIVFLMFAAGTLLNTVSLSPELLEPPADTLEKFRASVGPSDSKRPAALPQAPWPEEGSWSYREYVEWQQEQNPGLPGAEAYLRWCDGLDLNEFFKKDLLHSKRDLWRECLAEGKPFPSDLEQWLLENQDCLATIRRLAAEGLPGPDQEDFRDMSGEALIRSPVLNFLRSQTSVKILGAEALRLLVAGDEKGCAEQLAASYRLTRAVDKKPWLISELIAIAMGSITTQGINAWISYRPASPEILRTLLQELNYGMEETLSEGSMLAAFEDEYRIVRQHTVRWLNTPWTSFYKDWDYHNKSWGERIVRAPVDAFYSINARVNADKLLGLHDEMWGKIASDMAKPYHGEDRTSYGEFLDGFILAGKGYGPYAPAAAVPNFLDADPRRIVYKAKIAVTRAAVHVLLLQQDSDAAPAVDFSDPIWRDPFGEEPLFLESGPNHTLIYSIGPDLKDQQARTTYDPTNGTVSAGDIAIRIQAPAFPEGE